MYSLTECKEQTGNSYTASCQYFPGLPNLIQSLSVCHSTAPFSLFPQLLRRCIKILLSQQVLKKAVSI